MSTADEDFRKATLRAWWERVGRALFVRIGGKGAAQVTTGVGLPLAKAAMAHGVDEERLRCVRVLRALSAAVPDRSGIDTLAVAAGAIAGDFGFALPPGEGRTQKQFEQENHRLFTALRP